MRSTIAMPGSALAATVLLLLEVGRTQADAAGLEILDSTTVAARQPAGSRGRQGVAPVVQLAGTNEEVVTVGIISAAEGSTLINGCMNTLDANAFTDSTGLISVIQSSVNQVVIQESNIVALQYLSTPVQ